VLAVFVVVSASMAISDVPLKTGSEFTFARVQFNMDRGWVFQTREQPWHHDYPFSEDLLPDDGPRVNGYPYNARGPSKSFSSTVPKSSNIRGSTCRNLVFSR
jgi:hypothetical protein